MGMTFGTPCPSLHHTPSPHPAQQAVEHQSPAIPEQWASVQFDSAECFLLYIMLLWIYSGDMSPACACLSGPGSLCSGADIGGNLTVLKYGAV